MFDFTLTSVFILVILVVKTLSQCEYPINAPLPVSNANGCDTLAGGGWVLVRHVASSNGKWYSTTDDGKGTQCVQPLPNTLDATDNINLEWSFTYSNTIQNIWGAANTQILYATGDCNIYMIVDYNEIYGVGIDPNMRIPICVRQSSIEPASTSSSSILYRGAIEDPWIAPVDHGEAIQQNIILYGENSYDDNGEGRFLSCQNGLGCNVWIRQMPNNTPPCMVTSSPSALPTTNPSEEPTNGPSVVPTNNPSDDPTNGPTDDPTNDPSNYPTNVPSGSPTATCSDFGQIEECSNGCTITTDTQQDIDQSVPGRTVITSTTTTIIDCEQESY